jgi:hypothetical protein
MKLIHPDSFITVARQHIKEKGSITKQNLIQFLLKNYGNIDWVREILINSFIRNPNAGAKYGKIENNNIFYLEKQQTFIYKD